MTDTEVYASEFAKRLAALVSDYTTYLEPGEIAGCLESETYKVLGYAEYVVEASTALPGPGPDA